MDKSKLLLHMQTVLSEVIKEDEENWSMLDEHEEDLDRAYHHGYASAIQTVTEFLNDK